MATLSGRDGTALLVIDLQLGVLEGCFDTAGVLERTAALIARARAAGVPVIFVQHEEPGMERGSEWWQFSPEIQPATGDARVYKQYRDSFAGTTLAENLARLGVSRLVVAGAQSDYCIRATTHHAAADGYDVTLVSDAHTTADCAFDGQTISAEQMVGHINQNFSGLEYPEQDIGIATHDAVRLAG